MGVLWFNCSRGAKGQVHGNTNLGNAVEQSRTTDNITSHGGFNGPGGWHAYLSTQAAASRYAKFPRRGNRWRHLL